MNVEQEEAKKALESLAREIHGIYGQHAAEKGLTAPRWEDLPDSAKAISRDISRLVLAKMQEAYLEGRKSAPPEPAEKQRVPDAFPFALSLEKILGDLGTLASRTVDQVAGAVRRSPISLGLDAAISKVIEKVALDVISSDEALIARIREVVESELGEYFSGEDREG